MTLEIIYFLVFSQKLLRVKFSLRVVKGVPVFTVFWYSFFFFFFCIKETNRGPVLIIEEAGGAGATLFPGLLRISTEA